MKGGNAMNQQEFHDNREVARRICDKGMALINESMEKMETDWELSRKMLDEGIALWERGSKMWSEVADPMEFLETQNREKQHPKKCSCKQCQLAEPIRIAGNALQVLELLRRKKEN